MGSQTAGTKRNYGLDALRMLAAVYVVAHHSIEWGGLHGSVQPGTLPYLAITFVGIWVYCMVNIFILISGYAGFREKEEKTDYSKIAELWLEIVFYCVIITFVYVLIKPELVAARDIWDMLFPLTDGLFWFFSAYAGLCLVKPLLDTAIRNTGKDQLKLIMAVLFPAFSAYSILADPFHLEKGFTFIWILILYLFGAGIKRCGIGEKMSPWKAAAGIFLCAFAAWAWMNFGPEFVFLNRRYTGDLFFLLTSPTTLGMAVFHLLLFSKFRFPEKINKVIAFLAPGSFAVYILNTHRCVWFYSLENRFAEWARRPLWAVPKILLFSALFALVGMLIDSLRRVLFRKLNVRKALYELMYGPRRLNAALRLAAPGYIIAFFLIWSVLFWKCRYGSAGTEESGFLADALRAYRQGSAAFIREGAGSHMASMLLFPLIRVYFAFFGDTEGILLNFRMIHTFLWGCAAFFFYCRLRRFSHIGAVIASLTFLMYAPFCVQAFTPGSMGLLMLANACIISLTAEKYTRVQYFISGLFLAAAAVCCPYLLIPCVLLSPTMLFLRNRYREEAVMWLFISLGACTFFAAVLIPAIFRTDIQSVRQGITAAFSSPEQQNPGFIRQVFRYFTGIVRSSGSAPYVLSGIVLAGLVSLLRKKARDICFIAVCVLGCVWMFALERDFRDIAFLMVPASMAGLFCMLRTDDRRIRKLFFFIWLPGVIYSCCRIFPSNQGFPSIAESLSLSAMAGVFMIVNFAKTSVIQPSRRWMKTAVLAAAVFLLAAQLGGELSLRYHCVAYENGISEQLSHAQSGPQKGIRMTPEKLGIYNNSPEDDFSF